MINPIVLTSFGETITGYPGSEETDDSKLGGCCSCIGVHDVCEGFVDIKEISTTHKAIICRECHLRVVVPASIQTYGQLREYLVRKK